MNPFLIWDKFTDERPLISFAQNFEFLEGLTVDGTRIMKEREYTWNHDVTGAALV